MEFDPYNRTVTKVSIDSGYRTNGTSSNFKVLFKTSIPRVLAYRVENISVPFSYLPYRQDLAALTFTFTGSTSGVVTAIMPNVPYTDVLLINYVTAFFDLAVLPHVGPGTISVSLERGRVEITSSAENFTLTAANLAASTGWKLLGFTVPDLTAGPTLRGDEFYNLSGDNRIYLHSQIISGSNDRKIGDADEMTITDSIMSIPVTVNSGDTIYKDIPGPWCPCASKDIRSLDFSLRFGNNEVINLNGLDWGAEITFLQEDAN
jgi:hypothetical protein